MGSLETPVLGLAEVERLDQWLNVPTQGQRVAQTGDERPFSYGARIRSPAGNRTWAALVGGRCTTNQRTKQPSIFSQMNEFSAAVTQTVPIECTVLIESFHWNGPTFPTCTFSQICLVVLAQPCNIECKFTSTF